MTNPLLQRDEHGMFPGQAENGIPDFLNVTLAKIGETFAPLFQEILPSPEANPPATPPSWVPPWEATSPPPDAWPL